MQLGDCSRLLRSHPTPRNYWPRVVFDRAAGSVQLEANVDATVLVLAGEPIDEPIVGHGPFVMNTQEEIAQAMEDFNSGRFGQINA